MINVTWTQLKAMIDAGLKYKGTKDAKDNWFIVCQDAGLTYLCELPDDEASDYKTNYDAGSSLILEDLTPAGVKKVAAVKADGNSKTYISHNLASDGSAWTFNNLGVLTKVYKAEVQFTLDVVEGFNTDINKKLILDIMAGGNPVPSEQKVFTTIFDVYDLGNKHYYTPDGGAASMGGGIVTVVFDYTDAISLDPALGMAMRFQMENGTAMGGTHCSVSLVAGPA